MRKNVSIKDLRQGYLFGNLEYLYISEERIVKYGIVRIAKVKCVLCGNDDYIPVRYLLRGERTRCHNCDNGGSQLSHDEMMLYRRAEKILNRCNNTRHESYKNYGGRGIKCLLGETPKVVVRSISKVPGYKEGLQLDRIDNDGHYTIEHHIHGNNIWIDEYGHQCLGNLRWVTRSINNINKRTSVTLLDLATVPRTKKDIIQIFNKRPSWSLNMVTAYKYDRNRYFVVSEQLVSNVSTYYHLLYHKKCLPVVQRLFLKGK